MSAGNWVPEMIHMAGATDALKADPGKSHWIEWADVAAADPDIVILIPCGFELERVLTEAKPQLSGRTSKTFERPAKESYLRLMDTIYLIDPDHDWLIRSKYSLSFSTRKAFSLKPTARFAKTN